MHASVDHLVQKQAKVMMVDAEPQVSPQVIAANSSSPDTGDTEADTR